MLALDKEKRKYDKIFYSLFVTTLFKKLKLFLTYNYILIRNHQIKNRREFLMVNIDFFINIKNNFKMTKK